jgi:hypothetical protein
MAAFTYENKAVFEPLGLANHELHRSTLQFELFRLFIGKKRELKQELGLDRNASLRQHKACSPNAILLIPTIFAALIALWHGAFGCTERKRQVSLDGARLAFERTAALGSRFSLVIRLGTEGSAGVL